MRTSALSRFAFTVAAATAFLPGCGGSQPPIGAPGAMPQSHAIPHRADRAGWSMTSIDLLYVTTAYDPFTTNFYTYPGLQYVGSVPGGLGLCADDSGNVFVVNRGEWNEYAHGGTTPISTYVHSSYWFEHCSIDPNSGNLAVTMKDAGVAVFQHGSGLPTTYSGPFGPQVFCGYDSSGNLFVLGDSYPGGQGPQFYELPKGGTSLVAVKLPTKVKGIGQVQWDGRYLTIASMSGPTVYRLVIKNNTAKVVGTSQFGGVASKAQQSWIHDGLIVFPFNVRGTAPNVGAWNYPQGGAPIATLRGPATKNNQAVTISLGT